MVYEHFINMPIESQCKKCVKIIKMNQAQRNFLVDQIENKAKIKRDSFKLSDEEQPPSLSMFIFHKVMSGDFEIKSNKEIKELVLQKALKGTDRDDWLGNSWGSGSKDKVFFKLVDFFEIPEDYKNLLKEYRAKKEMLDAEKAKFEIEIETLITRIKLASNSTLEKMIKEVDDMGDLSLMNSKIKLLQ